MDKGRKLPNQISMLSFFLIAHPLVLLFKEPKDIVWKKILYNPSNSLWLALNLLNLLPKTQEP